MFLVSMNWIIQEFLKDSKINSYKKERPGYKFFLLFVDSRKILVYNFKIIGIEKDIVCLEGGLHLINLAIPIY